MTKNSKPQYFVRFDSYWQNSPDYFAGPFDSKADAEAEIVRAESAPGSMIVRSHQTASNVRDGIRVHGVMSYTSARRAGMRDESYGDDWSNVYNDVPANWNELPRNEY